MSYSIIDVSDLAPACLDRGDHCGHLYHASRGRSFLRCCWCGAESYVRTTKERICYDGHGSYEGFDDEVLPDANIPEGWRYE